MFYAFFVLFIVSLAGVCIACNRAPVIVDYTPALGGLMPRDRGEMTTSMRLHHLWMRTLAVNDEKMCMFEEACQLYGVDPSVDSKERDIVEECFLNMSSSTTPGITQIRLDELRMERSGMQ